MKIEKTTTEEGMLRTPDGRVGPYQRGTYRVTLSLKDFLLHPRKTWRLYQAAMKGEI
jgi:hypothetical protein